MYESHFNFESRPFESSATADDYFPSASSENARQALARAIDSGKGPGLIVGSVGTGKTMLLRVLANDFKTKLKVVVLDSALLETRRALLQSLLYELGLPYKDMKEGELRLSLMDHVSSPELCPNGVLILIDEADSLPLVLLEELRMMTNLISNGRVCIHLVLAGTTRLEETFSHPRLESFEQRLVGRFYLSPFTRQETNTFVVNQISRHGCSTKIFTEDALNVAHDKTSGVPRLINQLCDHSLILASLAGIKEMNGRAIEEAWADLQQLPIAAPTATNSNTSESCVIEFGELDSTDEPTQASALSSVDTEPTDTIEESVESAIVVAETEATALRVVHSEHDDSYPENVETNETEYAETTAGSGQTTATDEEPLPYIPRVYNPFEVSFGEEEIVFDKYASIAAFARRPERTVTSSEGRDIAALMYGAFDGDITYPTGISPVGEYPSFDYESDLETAARFTSMIDPASDPVMPEVTRTSVACDYENHIQSEVSDLSSAVREALVPSDEQVHETTHKLKESSESIEPGDESILSLTEAREGQSDTIVANKKKTGNYRRLFTQLYGS